MPFVCATLRACRAAPRLQKLSLATEIAGYVKHTVNATPVLGPCTRSSVRAVERVGESMRQRRMRWVNKVLESKRKIRRSNSDVGDDGSSRRRYAPGDEPPASGSPRKDGTRKGPVAFDSGRLQVDGLMSPPASKANGHGQHVSGSVVAPNTQLGDGDTDAKHGPSVALPPALPVAAGVVSPGHHTAQVPPPTPTGDSGGSRLPGNGALDISGGRGASSPARPRRHEHTTPPAPARESRNPPPRSGSGSHSARRRPRSPRSGEFDRLDSPPHAASARTHRQRSPHRGGRDQGRRQRLRAATPVERARASARGGRHPHDEYVIGRITEHVSARIGNANDLFSMELARWNADSGSGTSRQ